MIAAFASQDSLHIIKWTGRIRLHAGAKAYCGTEVDASNGVLQVPDAVFKEGATFTFDGSRLKACSRCRMEAQASLS